MEHIAVLFRRDERHEVRARKQYTLLCTLRPSQPIRFCMRNDRLGSWTAELAWRLYVGFAIDCGRARHR